MAAAKRILLVDDETDIARITAFRLKEEGYDVVEAQDGEKGFNSIKAQRFDLILLDLVLPGIDGYEVCRRLKSDPELKNIPVILFTASASNPDELEEKVKNLGADGFVVKPYEWHDLLAKIKALIG